MTNVLGIHDGHNAAAALIRDGQVVAAVQEERLSRIKNHDTFPSLAVERVLEMGGLTPSELDVVAFNGNHQPRHRTRESLMADLRAAGAFTPRALIRRWARGSFFNGIYRHLLQRDRLAAALDSGLNPDTFRLVDHHHAHATAAYWGSDFDRNESVLVLTCDGAGDDLAATVSVMRNGRLERRAVVGEGDSVAMVYLTVTQILGMVPNEHEYKIMGLAPYARRSDWGECLDVFQSLIEWDPDGAPAWRRRRGVPHAFYLYPYLRRRLEPFRFDIVAGALQQWIEEALGEWTRRAVVATGLRRVAASGGVFMNVKANKAIAELAEVDDLFVFPSCGDESNAIGAAWAAYVDESPDGAPPPEPLAHVYWGEAFSDAVIDQILTQATEEGPEWFTVEAFDDPTERVADLLSQGHIVARFDGPAEFGARALGNRSLLADPSRPEVVRRLNDAVKNRDFWMPFAATVLAERVGEYLSNPKQLRASFMIQAFDTIPPTQAAIQAATHPYDGTVRPQILTREANPRYHALLKAFERRTGRGALLNTSFNLHGAPMVYSPKDALEVLQHSGLTWLQLGNRLVQKKS